MITIEYLAGLMYIDMRILLEVQIRLFSYGPSTVVVDPPPTLPQSSSGRLTSFGFLSPDIHPQSEFRGKQIAFMIRSRKNICHVR
jgi:hypothetical protein